MAEQGSVPGVIFGGMCCFCGKEVLETETDPCRVTVANKHDLWQVWFAHGECFKSRLADLPEAPGFFDPAHF